jgi:hypothetical protein
LKPLSIQVKTVVLLIHPSEFKTTVLCVVCVAAKFGFSPWGKNWDANNTWTCEEEVTGERGKLHSDELRNLLYSQNSVHLL